MFRINYNSSSELIDFEDFFDGLGLLEVHKDLIITKHTLQDVDVNGRDMIIQTSKDWTAQKKDGVFTVNSAVHNSSYVFFGTATPVSVMKLGSHRQEMDCSRPDLLPTFAGQGR